MDPRDFFRGLFGFDKGHFGGFDERESDRFPVEPRGDEDEYHDGSDIDHMFNHFHEEVFKQMQHLNRQMEDMFKTFGSFDFHSDLPPSMGLPEAPVSPRERMLKPSPDSEGSTTDPDLRTPGARRGIPSRFGDIFSIPRFESRQPKDRVDKDLDEEVQRDGLSKVLPRFFSPEHDGKQDGQPRMFSQNSRVSVVTIRGADGKLEQRKTVRNSDGNEETTVTRQFGDRAHTVKTRKDELGVVEETETFQNMEKDDLKAFDETWINKGRQPAHPRDEMILPRNDTTEKSFFGKLFDFSHWKK